jgi:hypothetical protein
MDKIEYKSIRDNVGRIIKYPDNFNNPKAVLLPLYPGCSDTAPDQQYLRITVSLPVIELQLTRQPKVTQIFDLADLYQNYNSTEARVK